MKLLKRFSRSCLGSSETWDAIPPDASLVTDEFQGGGPNEEKEPKAPLPEPVPMPASPSRRSSGFLSKTRKNMDSRSIASSLPELAGSTPLKDQKPSLTRSRTDSSVPLNAQEKDAIVRLRKALVDTATFTERRDIVFADAEFSSMFRDYCTEKYCPEVWAAGQEAYNIAHGLPEALSAAAFFARFVDPDAEESLTLTYDARTACDASCDNALPAQLLAELNELETSILGPFLNVFR